MTNKNNKNSESKKPSGKKEIKNSGSRKLAEKKNATTTSNIGPKNPKDK